MKNKLSILLIAAALLAGCHTVPEGPDEPAGPGGPGQPPTDQPADNPGDQPATDPVTPQDTIIPPISSDDIDFCARLAVSVVYSGNSATVTGTTDSVTAEVSGADVVIRSTVKGLQIAASGSGSGSLKIYSDYKYQLLMQSLTLESDNGPAICNQGKKSLFLTLEGTNTLSDRSGYPTENAQGEDQKACLFSEGQVLIQGSGSLNVNGSNNHALASDDYIIVTSGHLTLSTTANAAKAMKANDYIRIAGGQISITQQGERVTEGTDASYCTGIKADSVIIIEGGAVQINSKANGGRGLNADQGIIITGGELTINMTGNGVSGSSGNRPGGGGGGPGGWGGGGGSTSSTSTYTNPCIKTDGYVSIQGGTITLTTSGTRGFGIRAQGAITMTGGTVNAQTTGQAAECIESKTGIELRGGYVFAQSKQDDAINSSGAIRFSGAWVYAISNGNDAVDSNYGRTGAIDISDGVVVAISSKGAPEEGLDCDNNRYITISGGYAFSGGALQGGGGGWGGGGGASNESVGSASQGYCFTGSYAISSGTYYGIYDSQDNLLFSLKALTSVSSSNNSLSLVSAPGMQKNGSCSIRSSATAPSGAQQQWDGYLYIGGSQSAANSVKTFTAK